MARVRNYNGEYDHDEENTAEYPFLASLSHEVRTPMNAIVGLSEILMNKVTDLEEMEYVSSLQTATQNLLMVINNVIDYDEMSGGRLVLHKERMNLEKVIREVIDMAKINIGDRDILFVTDINPCLPEEIMMDSTRLKQVLVYFLSNAAKNVSRDYVALTVNFADSEKTKIRFTIENTEEGLPIMAEFIEYIGSELHVIEDTGSSKTVYFDFDIIAVEGAVKVRNPETIETSFAISLKNRRERQAVIDYFDRASVDFKVIDNPTELFIYKDDDRPEYLIIEYERYRRIKDVKEFWELNTKVICLANIFTDILEDDIDVFRRPFFYPDLLTLFHKKTQGGKRETMFFEGARILVVDDNAINLKVIAGLLLPYKATVDTATGGEEAIRMIHRTRYDLVLMDHMMPGVDGTQATRIIRQAGDEYFKTLPIVALSANVLEESRILFTESGMNDFVAKPIDLNVLIDTLKKWIPESKQQVGYLEVENPADGLPDFEVLELEHIIPQQGLSYTGGNGKMYMTILRDFLGGALSRKVSLTKLVGEEDVGRYTIEIHSLKSLSRTIGADNLSFMAEELEKLGHKRDREAIKEKHGDLLKEYEAVEAEIKKIANIGRPRTRKIPLLREKAGEILRELFHAMDEFDYDAAEKICDELERYEYDSLVEESYQKLRECVDNIDYDGTKQQAVEMIALL